MFLIFFHTWDLNNQYYHICVYSDSSERLLFIMKILVAEEVEINKNAMRNRNRIMDQNENVPQFSAIGIFCTIKFNCFFPASFSLIDSM